MAQVLNALEVVSAHYGGPTHQDAEVSFCPIDGCLMISPTPSDTGNCPYLAAPARLHCGLFGAQSG